ncbi:MAG: DNA polymerase III subunit delta [Bacilli bacterium]|nr:DNA polymerase III subunit delta [Bacilli bacterium]
MDKLYLIEGENNILINKEIKKIISKFKDIDIIKCNLEERTIDDIIEILDTYDMFQRKKIVIASNPIFYLNVTSDFNLDKFLKYLKNPSDNILIIVANKINNRLKVSKDTLKYFNYIKVNDLNIDSFIKENLEGFKMDNLTINYFITRIGKDYNDLLNELNKLKAFKIKEKQITKSDIDLICRKNFDNTIFDLIDAIIKKDKIKLIDLYNYFTQNGTDVFQILVLLANQIRLIYNVKTLSNLTDSKIAEILEVKEYPIKLARGKGINYKSQELLKILYNLGQIDEDIKSGKQLPNISLISYILEI